MKTKSASAGFSLPEAMIAFLLFIFIFDAGWTMYQSANRTNSALSGTLSAQEEARKAFLVFTASVRSASPSSVGAYPIAAASSTAFSYFSDIDDDGLQERLRYFFSGNNLNLGILEPAGSPLVYTEANEKVSTVVHYLVRTASSSLFSYYDSGYDGTTAPLHSPISIPSIRLVKIILTVDQDPAKPPLPMSFSTQTSIRNLKDNL